MAKSLFTDTARPRIKNFMTTVMTKMSQTAGKRAARRCAPTKTARREQMLEIFYHTR